MKSFIGSLLRHYTYMNSNHSFESQNGRTILELPLKENQ